ncbi:MAG: hypothetical protein GY937_15890 [bacterium]|nr:hypothetical protein [bacterium]
MSDIGSLMEQSNSELADRIVSSEPWISSRLGLTFGTWSRGLLSGCGFPRRSRLHVVGSAATGVSMHPEKAGRAFREFGGPGRASDLDLALVDARLFESAWNDLVGHDRQGDRIDIRTRGNVYWGRIEQKSIPARTEASRDLRQLVNAIRRSKEFRGYPVSIRLYRRQIDLREYLVWSISALRREF